MTFLYRLNTEMRSSQSLYYMLSFALSAYAFANERVIAVDNHSVDDLSLSRRLAVGVQEGVSLPEYPLQPLLLTKAELANQPDLLLGAYVTALKANDMATVETLLSLYRTLAEPDPMLLQWGEAILALKRSDFSQAIDLYRELIAKQPDAQAVRLQLAIALLKNRQNEAAYSQFEKLRNERLPSELAALVEHYLLHLQKQDRFQFFVGANYLHEANVNNAPKAGTKINGFTPSSQPEKAEGISYLLNMHKTWSLRRGWFSEFETEFNGKYYWQNGKYNELSIRNLVGTGYRNAKIEWKMSPFFEQFLYAGGEQAKSDRLHRHSKQFGLEMNIGYWFAHHWKMQSRIEYSQQGYHHSVRHNANGVNIATNQTLSYLPNSRQSWSIGLDYLHKQARWKANSFHRYGMRLGWSQEWLKGISSHLQLSYAQRHYQMASAKQADRFAPEFFKVAQKNHEYGINLTLWQRNLHWQGITPKVTWAYQKVSSNNPFAAYDRHRVYFTLSKGF